MVGKMPRREDEVDEDGDRCRARRERARSSPRGRSPKRSTRRTSTRASSRSSGEEGDRRAARDAVSRQREGHCASLVDDAEYHSLRGQVLNKGERVDGRGMKDVRPISIDTTLLPRVHGSALFTRGQTQALVAVTLGTVEGRAAPRLDRRSRASSRRRSCCTTTSRRSPRARFARCAAPAAARSATAIWPSARCRRCFRTPAAFPYTIRIVSDVLESNGSSSMATCVRRLARAVRCGRADSCGRRRRRDGAGEGRRSKYAILTDILGTEDHLGDMDFKVAGTEQGITSIQMDIKIEGLDLKIMREALAQAKEGRLHILGEMKKALAGAALGSVAVRTAHRDAADQPREDRRSDRTEGQDHPRHSGRDGRRAHRGRHGTRHDRGGWRRGDGACASR